MAANFILAGIVVILTIVGLAAELAAYVIGRIIARRQQFDKAQREANARDQHIADQIAMRITTAPMYQDPQRAESDAWTNAYPEPENHS